MPDFDFKKNLNALQFIAMRVLPRATESNNPTERLVGAMGAIPDTLEWFMLKTSFLSSDDLQGLAEWNDYIIEKANAYIKAKGISV